MTRPRQGRAVTTYAALDEDAVIACADLIGRTGARSFQVGYLSDEPPHRWYAHAQYKGARISIEDQPGPVEACDALSRRLLSGAKCAHCGKLVSLSAAGAVAYDSTLVDGSRFTREDAARAGLCRWRRMGPKWIRGCEAAS